MSKHLLAASTLSSALGLALAMAATPGLAQQPMKDMPQIVKDNMARMEKGKLEKCYGINTVSKNDCAEGAHSCAGQATKRAIRNRSCCCRPATAARSRAAASRPPDRDEAWMPRLLCCNPCPARSRRERGRVALPPPPGGSGGVPRSRVV